MRRSIVVAAIAAFLLATCVTVYAGNITGRLQNARGESLPNAFNSVNIEGDNGAIGNGDNAGGTSNEAGNPPGNNYGVFYFPGLAQGTYSQGFVETDGYGLLYRKGIAVPASGDATWTVMAHNPSVFCYGTEYFPVWRTWLAQSFRATGENLCSVSLRLAGTTSNVDVEVAILDGDNPSAPQLGPTRYIYYDPNWNMNSRTAYWSAGEVPLVHGQVYTVRMRPTNHNTGGQFSPYHQTVRTKGRSEIPDGRTWYDGSLLAEPPDMVITTDDAGIVNTMAVCSQKDLGYANVGSYAAQSFVARGTSVVAVTWAANYNGRFAVSVHTGSPTGTRIGPAKYVRGQEWWNSRCIVTMKPGEIPTTVGQTYYLKIRRVDGAGFAMGSTGGANFYSGGQAYIDANPQSFDYRIGIYQEKSTGSIDQQRVTMNNYRVDTITSNSARVYWTTSPFADGTVDYGEDTPYTTRLTNAANAVTHAFALTGLKPNTMYHVRAISKATGYREGITKDLVFCTLPSTTNMLANPGFETGNLNGWTPFSINYGDVRVTGPWLGSAGPHTGGYGFAGAASGGIAQGGVYQRLAANRGQEYRLTAWVFTYNTGSTVSRDEPSIVIAGLDPAGGTNPGYIVNRPGGNHRFIPNGNVNWTPVTTAQDGGPEILFQTNLPTGVWTNVGVTAIATSNYITAFIYGGNNVPSGWSIFSVDDAVLTPTPAADATVTQALKTHPDGAYLRVSGAKCIATAAEAGAYYLETIDRQSGLRVETSDLMNVGELVTVYGYIRTKPSGERYLDQARVNSTTWSTELDPWCATMSRLGGAALGSYCAGVPGTVGPYNVGMLFRVAGVVKAVSGGYAWVNDGSLPGNGLKVDTGNLLYPLGVGNKVSLAGVVQIEGAAGSATVLLHPRSDYDVTTY